MGRLPGCDYGGSGDLFCGGDDFWYFCKESGFRKYDYHSRDPDIYDDSDVFRTERKIETVSEYLFTGIAFDAVANIYAGNPVVDLRGVLVLAVECAAAVAVFLILYWKNGFER